MEFYELSDTWEDRFRAMNQDKAIESLEKAQRVLRKVKREIEQHAITKEVYLARFALLERHLEALEERIISLI